MHLNVSGMTEVQSLLASIAGEMEKVSHQSQNKLAYEIMQGNKAQMREDLDRPTPWSVGSLRYKKVDENPIGAPAVEGAAVYFETPWGYSSGLGAEEWLGVQILGGEAAGPKRSEKRMQQLGYMPSGTVWVPAAEARRDRYGNISGALISAMLSNLGANPYGASQNPQATFALIGPPGNEEGVFQKVRGEWRPFLWFVPKPTNYSPRYQFYERAEREKDEKFEGIIRYYLDRALARLAT